MPTEEQQAAIDAAIIENLTGPKSVMADGQSTQMHSIQDQIAAAEYLERKTAEKRRGVGFRLFGINTIDRT